MNVTQRDVAKHLGITEHTAAALATGRRGLTPTNAKRMTDLTGEKAANAFLLSQTAVLKSKIEREAITAPGVSGRVASIIQSLRDDFRNADFDRQDPKFAEAIEELKEIAQAVLDFAGDLGEEGDDGVTVATKSSPASGLVERDMYGRRMS